MINHWQKTKETTNERAATTTRHDNEETHIQHIERDKETNKYKSTKPRDVIEIWGRHT